MTIKELIENKSTLDYQQICSSLIQTFRVDEKVNWESVLPAKQQQEYFGGESLRLIAEHPILSKQKDIRPIALKKGSISQMLFFYVCLNDSTLPKKQIQDVTKKFISGGDANRYIIWFFGNKENTQLKVVLSAKEGKKIVLKTLPFGVDQPYYKTYNFILNEINQKVGGLFVEPTDLWKALWNAFDISIINRNFYNEIKSAFTDLLKQLNKKGTPFINEEDKVQFAIRLIGRIIFCWFLKRKEVLHDEAISSEAVKVHSHKNYYYDLLEPLFFDVLNTPSKERKGGLPKIIAHYPFLNGGLFEAQETDYKQHLLLNIDNDWFYNLFSKTLERYNFTVDENSSSNAEIAIDPEMLGRIFENLLAEQNPETGDSARKATGSFYTPREIVDYMVEQSVSEFLKTALALDEKTNSEIEDFVHTQVLPDALAKHEGKISNELAKIKVLDPACGSGAFPIGILQKIVALKQQLHPKAKNYKLKLDTIQNSIYGVDIQPMAVELSRLRCWLSLVVDEDPKDIKALPNLDFKFVCADSLMVVGKMNHQLDLSKSAERIEELKELRTEFFIASGKRKKELEKKFKQIQTSLNNNFLEWDGKSKLVENLASWKPFDNHKTNWFDEFWMFGMNEKFDVVIGNPPYINTKRGIEAELKKAYKALYDTAVGQFDVFSLFIERGTKLSRGILCFIVPKPVIVNENYEVVREYLFKSGVKQIVIGSNVFENAGVESCVFVTQGKQSENISVLHFENQTFENVNEIETNFCKSLPFKMINSEIKKSEINLFKRINETKKRFENVVQITRGIEGGKNDECITEIKNKFKLLQGGDQTKYKVDFQNLYVDYDENNVSKFKDLKVYFSEKILIRRVANELISTVDNKNYLTLNTIYCCNSTDKNFPLKVLCAIVNSKIISFWFKKLFVLTDKLFPYIRVSQLNYIPIPVMKEETNQAIITLVDYMLLIKEQGNENTIHQSVSNNSVVKHLEEILDGLVLELYFGDEMQTKKVSIVKLVQKELEKAKDKDTTKSIYNFYKSVSHPDSEIRNRILSFAIVSPDILKPILQG